MHRLEFDAAEAEELLELIEGEGSCALVLDGIDRLYDELTARAPGEGCAWAVSEPERAEIVRELDECAETVELPVLERLLTSLRGTGARPGRSP